MTDRRSSIRDEGACGGRGPPASEAGCRRRPDAGEQTGKTSSLNSSVVARPGKSPAPQRISASVVPEFERVVHRVGVEQHVDLRMARLEPADPADEPGRGEGRARVDDQKPSPLGLAHRAGGARENGEALGEARRAGRAGLGQREAPAGPLDQRRADLLLQRPHLLRHRRLRDVQILRRPRERQPARHRFERAQRGQRRKTVDRLHRIACLSYHGINIALNESQFAIYPGPRQALDAQI